MKQTQRRLIDLHRISGRPLHGLFFRLTLDVDTAAELLQDLYLRLARSAGFAAAEDPTAYAYRAAFHLVSNHRRTRRRKPPPAPLLIDPTAATLSPVECATRDEEFQQLLAALDRLPDGPRQAFILRHLQQLPYEEIGGILETTAHGARALTHRALRSLRNHLNPNAEKEGIYARLD